MSQRNDLGQIALPILDPKGKNFRAWSLRVEMIFKGKGLAEYLQKAKTDIGNDQAKMLLSTGIEDQGLLEMLSEAATAHSAWTKLKKRYEKKDWVLGLGTRAKLSELKYSDPHKQESVMDEIDSLLNQLSLTDDITEKDRMVVHCGALKDNYCFVREAVILHHTNEKPITLDSLKAIIRNHTASLIDNEKPRSAVYHLSGKNVNTKDKSKNVTCFVCGKHGHYARDCSKRKGNSNKDDEASSDDDTNSNNRRDNTKRSSTFGKGRINSIRTRLSNVNTIEKCQIENKPLTVKFVMDTGASLHFVNNQSILVNT